MNRKKIIYRFCVLIVITAISNFAIGQSDVIQLNGEISFLTSQSIYFKFGSTGDVQIGDTVYLQNGNLVKPIAVITNKSSVSCVGRKLENTSFQTGTSVFVNLKTTHVAVFDEDSILNNSVIQKDTLALFDSTKFNRPKANVKPDIGGSLSINSYTNISGFPQNNAGYLKYSVHLFGDELLNSKWSAETYINARHYIFDKKNRSNFSGKNISIYKLSFKHSLGKNSKITIGRSYVGNISGIGAFDGALVQSKRHNMNFGVMLGTRPDHKDFSVNLNMLQYGFYAGHNYDKNLLSIKSTIALFDQRNNLKIDRRYLYFQQYLRFFKKVNILYTFDVDLYAVTDSVSKNEFNLTNFYFLIRYKPVQVLRLSFSYNSRKNIIYYETYKSILDQILTNVFRYGYTFRLNYNIMNNVYFGTNMSYRYKKSDINPSLYANTFITYSEVPYIESSATVTSSYINSAYLTAYIYGINFRKNLSNNKLLLSYGYQYIKNHFINSENTYLQNLVNLGLNYRFGKKFTLALNFEGSIEDEKNQARIYLQLKKRF